MREYTSKERRFINLREHRIIKLVADGRKNSDIAQELKTSESVIKNYLRVIFDKLGMDNRLQLALWYEAHYGPYSHLLT